MEGWLLGQGASVLLVGVFVAVAVGEMARPARPVSGPAGRRWFGNLLLFLASGAVAALPTATGLAAALASGAPRLHLLDRLALPHGLRVVVAVLALDALAYATHRLSHRVALLWRFHAVHHSDPEPDVTTTLRHHPGEALLEAAVRGVAVLVLGLAPAEVALYALLAWGVQALAHANIAAPTWLARWVGAIVVTPAFHRVHHSRRVEETDSNYGQVLAVWDRLFGTARGGGRDAGGPAEFGLDAFRDARSQGAHRLLAQPFLRAAGTGEPRDRSPGPSATVPSA